MAEPEASEKNMNLLTLQQAAELLTVDYETARRWIVKKNAIPYIQLGPEAVAGKGDIRVYRRDVERLMVIVHPPA